MKNEITHNQQIINKIHSKLNSLNIEILQDIVLKLNNDFRKEAGLIFSEALKSLENKMPALDFINFCDKMD